MMQSSRWPVFHIGANKAGSTTLQQGLFARHPEILNLGKPIEVKDARRAVNAIRRNVEHAGTSTAVDIHALWKRSIEPSEGRLPVYSHEELIRSCYYPTSDPSCMPRSIVDMAGPVRVVIVIRQQLDLIESLYIHKANVRTYLPFDNWLAVNSDWISTYCFHEVATAWARIVGKENVGIFLFEEMAQDSNSFAGRLSSFLDVNAEVTAALLSSEHKNPRKSNRIQAYVKLRSTLLPRVSLGTYLPAKVRDAWQDYLAGGRPSRESLSQEWRVKIENAYRNDNRKLAEHFRLPLEKYNYPI